MGRDAEGRAEPVQIKLRPKGVGIGFSDNDDEEDEEKISFTYKPRSSIFEENISF